MTDRINGFSVTLERDMRDDDVASLLDAVRHLRGVVDVRPVIVTSDAHFAEQRARMDFAKRLMDLAGEIRNG